MLGLLKLMSLSLPSGYREHIPLYSTYFQFHRRHFLLFFKWEDKWQKLGFDLILGEKA